MKIGMVGSGKIVQTCLETFRHMEAVEGTALCVRPQSREKGQALAREFSIPVVYTEYPKLLSDSSLDFIYIAIANHMHYTYARQALEAGKNVILEKPFTATADEARALVELAREKRLYLFEAITNLYSPAFKMMRQRLADLGEIKMMQCNYSQYSSRYDSYLKGEIACAFDPACAGGALYDINVYNLHLVIALLGAPNEIQYIATRGFNGIDTSGIVTMKYDRFTAECCGAKDSESPGHAIIQGTKGYMRIVGPPSLCPALEMMIDGKQETFTDSRADRHMMAEFDAFEQMWRQGDFEQCMQKLEHSAVVMESLYQARQHAGIPFHN